jgi:hypothetical protein
VKHSLRKPYPPPWRAGVQCCCTLWISLWLVPPRKLKNWFVRNVIAARSGVPTGKAPGNGSSTTSFAIAPIAATIVAGAFSQDAELAPLASLLLEIETDNPSQASPKGLLLHRASVEADPQSLADFPQLRARELHLTSRKGTLPGPVTLNLLRGQ